MKKNLLIALTIAVLGGLSFYVNNNKEKDGSSLSSVNTSSSNKSAPVTSSATQQESYKDGTYTGNAAETPYGPVQVAAVISGGKISDIKFLDMPNSDDRSTQITNDSEPQLKQATISAQNADIDFVSGATSTSYGYQESLQAALDQAKSS